MNAMRLAARLKRMSGAELAFRLRVAARSEAGRVAAACRPPRWRVAALAGLLDSTAPLVREAAARLEAGNLPAAHACLARHFRTRENRFPVAATVLPVVRERILSEFPGAAAEAAADIERLQRGRFNLLGYRDLDFSDCASRRAEGTGVSRPGGVDWQIDPVHGRRPPVAWWSRVPFLDPAVGDHKIIWELNRHQHFLRLGRAAWLTGDPACRRTFAGHLRGWLEQNPPGMGINWSSMLELGLRSLSWLWALHLFSSQPAAEKAAHGDGADPWIPGLLAGLHAQLQQVLRNLSRYFSPNTHLTGEALALYVCGRALPELRDAAGWATAGRQILLEQIGVQVTPDGGHCERATHYLRYTLDFYLMALAFARATADGAATGAFEEACERLAWATRLLSDEGGRLPNIGDDDGGRLWPLREREPGDVRDSLAAAAILLDRPGLLVGRLPEEPLWLLGPSLAWPGAQPSHGDGDRRAAVCGAEGVAMGYHVARPRPGDHLVIDAGPHGFLNGGHAHADSLSIVYTVGNRPLAIDPGTFTYTMSREWRDRLRSSAWHNTLTVDGRSQSVPDGPFHWRNAAAAHAQASERGEGYWFFEGVHDGYLPLVHRRRVAALDSGCLVVVDTVVGTGDHLAEVHWHLDGAWKARREAEGVIVLDHELGGSCQIATPGNTPAVLVADEATGLGWRSPAYGRLVPCTTARLTAAGRLPLVLVSVFADWDGFPLRVERLQPASASAGGSGDGLAVRLTAGRHSDVLLFGTYPPLLPGEDAEAPRDAAAAVHRFGLGRFEVTTSARFAWLAGEAEASPRVLALVDGNAVVEASAPGVPGSA